MQALQSPTAKIHIPDVITKDLAISRTTDGDRRIRLSSNFLRLMGWDKGVPHDLLPLADGGIAVSYNPQGSHRIYQRRYTGRKNNPLETQIDIQNQRLIDTSIPGYTERVHFEIRRGSILIKPLANRTFAIRKSMANWRDSPAAFVAMTSGIDAKCLADTGFKIDTILEYRPSERRDKTDLTETGALTALHNVAPRVLINEDITTVDMARVARLMEGAPPCSILHLSIQCDEFSTQKTKRQKAEHVESLESSVDQVYDGLRLIETVRPAMVLVENVPGFANHHSGQLLKLKLQKWGYHVTDSVMDARDYGGLTSRSRYYLIASVWPGFVMPQAGSRRGIPVWTEIEPFLPHCRDVSHTKSVQQGLETGRIRLIRPDSLSAPTVTKSQNRQCKDSVYIEHQGRYLLPSLELLARLNGLQDFDLSSSTEEIATEIVGQSIDVPMHEQLARAALEHIRANSGSQAVINLRRQTSLF